MQAAPVDILDAFSEYDSEEFRTCNKCGTIMLAPAAL
jgi:hypothetical protein